MSIMPSASDEFEGEHGGDTGKDDYHSNGSPVSAFDYRKGGDSGFDYRNNNSSGDGLDFSSFQRDGEGSPKGASKSPNSAGFEVSLLPPDQRPGIPSELLNHLVVDPEIDEDTEAAEALRANANVKVGKVGKVARSVGAQSVRKVAKRLTLRGQSGNRRGKPPRIPPGMTASQLDAHEDIMLAVEEGEFEESSESSMASDVESNQDPQAHHPHAHHPHHHNHPNHPHHTHHIHHIHHHEGHESFQDSYNLAGSISHHDPEGSKSKRAHHKNAAGNEDGKDIPTEVVAATMEAGRKLMGAIDPHNMLQLQRWRRKNKKGKKDKRKSYVKGKVIDGRHELYTLSIAVMLGVRTSIARTNTIIASSDRKKLITPQDFMAEEKYEFAPKGSPTTPPHKLSHTFKFKDYAPVAFAYLRRMFGVNEFDFLLSVCGNANFIEFISNAKSGQFFFYSSDGKYMIKTMTNAESKFLRRILPHYFRHCTQNPNTLITKFLGMYRVKLYHLRRNVKFVIMNSVYYTDKSLQTFYDLKGSDIGREAKPGQDVLKDNDLRSILPEQAFNFKKSVQERLRAQVVSDCNFLRKMQIMDYSMLIGIHHVPPQSEKEAPHNVAEGGFRIKERRSHGSDSMGHAANAAREHDSKRDPTKPPSFVSHGGTVHSDDSKKRHSAPNGVGKLGGSDGDSTRRLITDIRESTNTVTNFEFAGLFEEEDDCSYLEGSEAYKEHEKNKGGRFQKGIYEDVEVKKEQTIEQIYWPFHRFYDINGLRRMKPKPCFRCNTNPCVCDGHEKIIRAWKVPDFVPPLSDRKDGGIMMDTSDVKGPMTWHGPTGDRLYEGKIFYMGIIDILQQYNARKRVETSYRRMESKKGLEPSCVSPLDYAERFVRFFDEYSGRAGRPATNPVEQTEVEVSMSNREISSREVDIQVQQSPDNGYNRKTVQLGSDGKPKGRTVVS